ncbi:hypothetical protein R50073_38190 [Maricurvus nonylphenolicus]|uniref:transposase n=1 Tax=Maricurvus nonylphenolicus TaxID=1008307 RepID=UPI0036F3CA95
MTIPTPSVNTDTESNTHYLQFNSHGQRPLFAQRADYAQMLDLFDCISQQQQISTLVFCLLPHSIHWLIHAPDENAEAIGQWLQHAYTQLYNEQQQRNGSLFNKRMLCHKVDPFQDFAELSHQIHHLPVAGKLVPDPAIYPWSSHKLYLNRSNQHPRWFLASPLLNRIANQRASQIRRYSQFMAPAPKHWAHIENKQDSGAPLNAIQEPLEQETSWQPDLEWLVAFVCQDYQISTSDLHLWRRQRLMNEVKAVIASLAQQWQVCGLETLSKELQIDQEQLESSMRYLQQQKSLSLHRLTIALEKEIGPAPEPWREDEIDKETPFETEDEPHTSEDSIDGEIASIQQEEQDLSDQLDMTPVTEDIEAEIDAAIEAEIAAQQ